MHSILFVLEMPKEHDQGGENAMKRAVGKLNDSQMQDEAVERLSGNVLLLRASDGLPFLCKAIQVSEESGLAYRVLFLKKPPKWIRSYSQPHDAS